jgi:hypothetical protein
LREHRGANPALRLDHFLALDPDSREAIDYLASLETDGKLPPTVTWHTWRDHPIRLYNRPEALQPLKINRNGLVLELRTGEGQYVLIPPSRVNTGNYRFAPHLSPDDVEVALLPPDTLSLLQSLNNTNAFSSTRNHRDNHKSGRLNFTQGHRDDSLFHVANCLTKGGMVEEDITKVLEFLGENCSPAFPQKDILDKILSAERRKKFRERPIAEEVKEWALTTNGLFVTTDVYRDLDLTTRDHKKAAVMALLRLENEGLLEKCGEKRGCYRLIDKSAEELKWWEADTSNIVPLELPFDLHKLISVFHKTVIIVAGVTDSGKTALLLNTALLNRNKLRVNYFSLEMPEQELKKRLERFKEVGLMENMDEWRKVIFKERAHNFHQVIRPDEVNIIDYLEITKEFWQVADQISEIYNKLNKGVAIIALQKKQGQEYGLGGHFSAFRARLYISMDKSELKVIKAKNWNDLVTGNPANKVYGYKLLKGAKFIPWEK